MRISLLNNLFFVTLLSFSFFLSSCHGKRSGSYGTSDVLKDSSGRVVAVVDGDTYDLLLGNNTQVRIRMAAIDAPERGMPFYKVSKEYLSGLCMHKRVRMVSTGKDRNGRIIAFGFLEDGINLNKEMVKNGLAWHYKLYSSDPELSELERLARLNRIGLWTDEEPVAPWEFRKRKRTGAKD
jgi:micrococcal nuclease